jgi:hypothetical protein
MQARRVNAILESMQCSVWPYMRKVKSFSMDGEDWPGREAGGMNLLYRVSMATDSITHTVKNVWLTRCGRTRRFTTVDQAARISDRGLLY